MKKAVKLEGVFRLVKDEKEKERQQAMDAHAADVEMLQLGEISSDWLKLFLKHLLIRVEALEQKE